MIVDPKNGMTLTSRVAVVEFIKTEAEPFMRALDLIGGIDDLNTSSRNVTVKVGVFGRKAENHSSVGVVSAIIMSFDKAPKILLAESDTSEGTALERLQAWRELFNKRVSPFNLSDDTETRPVSIADEDMKLSHALFKPNVFVNTHILRTYEWGSILKNLFGCIPTPKKERFHGKEILPSLVADVFQAVGGVDLAVLDGTYLWHRAGGVRERTNTLIVGRDAVAVETVGATLAGLKPEEMPILQEFVMRGLGEGDMDNIEIVGAPLVRLRRKFASSAASLEEKAMTQARCR